MRFDDPVYGPVSFSDSVILDLMVGSKALRRLKGVSQIGANQFLQRGDFSRFEHSVGVAALLQRFGASRDEQVMGLIHDVSHPAFSHVIDFVFDTSRNEDFHEQQFEVFVKKTDIPAILQKHGLRIDDFLHAEKFRMLERPIPDLCADRIDYFLRHLVHEYHQKELAQRFLKAIHFDSKEGFFVSDAQTGREMAEWFLRANRELFADVKMTAASWILADSIRSGLRVGALTKDQLWTTDAFVLERLKFHAHPSVQNPLEKLFAGFSACEDEKIYDIALEKKSRWIDPFVKAEGGRLKRVSEVFPDFKQTLEAEKAQMQKTRFIRVD
ncbi:MAG: HD domain-containing protein [Candidatus Diapherotrites archaeon]|nr:HD domain-containing protein [Candidatus Diapherotrites archaeon]